MQLQRAADWLSARKVLPGQLHIADCIVTA